MSYLVRPPVRDTAGYRPPDIGTLPDHGKDTATGAIPESTAPATVLRFHHHQAGSTLPPAVLPQQSQRRRVTVRPVPSVGLPAAAVTRGAPARRGVVVVVPVTTAARGSPRPAEEGWHVAPQRRDLILDRILVVRIDAAQVEHPDRPCCLGTTHALVLQHRARLALHGVGPEFLPDGVDLITSIIIPVAIAVAPATVPITPGPIAITTVTVIAAQFLEPALQTAILGGELAGPLPQDLRVVVARVVAIRLIIVVAVLIRTEIVVVILGPIVPVIEVFLTLTCHIGCLSLGVDQLYRAEPTGPALPVCLAENSPRFTSRRARASTVFGRPAPAASRRSAARSAAGLLA